jgi:hypothetical protein
LLTTLIIFLLAFGAVWLLERTVHRTLQSIALITTGHAEAATVLYAVPLFPGVALHELSHAVMATVLGVKVRNFSLWPKRQNGGIRLGFVEILRTDAVRASLIGAAPLVFGSIALVVIGSYVFNSTELVSAIGAGDMEAFVQQIFATVRAPDALLWFYLVFAIANSMMPSPSDTQSWPPVLAFFLVGVGVLVLAGGASVLAPLLPGTQFVLRWLAAAFAITAFINVIVLALLWVVARLLEMVTGRRIEYKR